MTDYFKREAPELKQWLYSTDSGHDVMRHYQQGLNYTTPALTQLDASFTACLYDYLSRAEHFARLTSLPQELLVEGLTQVAPIRPNAEEKAQRGATFRRLEEAQACLRKIADSAIDIGPLLVQANQQLQWMELLKNGIAPQTHERTDYMRFRTKFEDGKQPESPFRKAVEHLRRIETALEQLHGKAEAAPLATTYGRDQPMVEECQRYAQRTMYPDLQHTFIELRQSLEHAVTAYDNIAREVGKKLKPDPVTPGMHIYDFTVESPQRMEELLQQQGEGSNVVRIGSAPRKNTETSRG